MTKHCPSCGEHKPLDDFHRCKQRPSGRKVYCKVCTSAKQKERRRTQYKQVRRVEQASKFKYKDVHSVRNRVGYLRRQYGMTPEDFAMLLASQGGTCAACGVDVEAGGRNAHIDHCHESGSVRGVLCHGCNVSLGLLGDDPERIMKLLSYLRRFK